MTNEPFLPADYSEPSNSDYLNKFENGATKVRFLDRPIISWEMWEDYTKEDGSEGRRVKRGRKEANQPIPQGSKLVWTALVWNYKDSRMQIWSVTQKSIRDQILELSRDEDYGNPINYDLKIGKTGEGIKTTYTVNALPPSVLTEEMKNTIMSTQVNIDAYFEGETPFGTGGETELEDVL